MTARFAGLRSSIEIELMQGKGVKLFPRGFWLACDLRELPRQGLILVMYSNPRVLDIPLLDIWIKNEVFWPFRGACDWSHGFFAH